MNKAIPAALGLVLSCTAVLAQQPAPDFATELRQANDRRNQNPQQGLTTCDAMLTKWKDPAQVKEIRLLKAEILVQLKKVAEATAELTKLQTDFANDKDVQARSALCAADLVRAQGKFPEAATAYQKAAKDFADLPERAAEALLREGDVRAKELNKPAEALAPYKAIEAQYGSVTRVAAEAARKAAGIMEAQTRDFAGAAAAYAALTDKYVSAAPDEKTVVGYYAKAIEMYRTAGKLQEALDIAKKGEKALEAVASKSPLLALQPAVLVQMKKLPEARSEAERIICAFPLELDLCQAVQAQVVESYRAENKFDDALGGAKTLYDAAGSEQTIREAAHVVAMMFRAADANLGRANEFLAFQRFGPNGPDGKPGTEDDIKSPNVLAGVKYPPTTPERDKRFTDAVAAQPETYDGFRGKAYLYVYWGKPKEALGFFRQAFRACPDASVPAAANELVLVGVKAVRSSFAGLDQVYEFISYGPKGKSGKENLPDPFAGM